MVERLQVGLFFGGRSGEHAVSLMSARSVLPVIPPARYGVVAVGITEGGLWKLPDRVAEALAEGPERAAGRHVTLLPQPDGGRLRLVETGETVARLDVVFPLLHGPFGEDGTLQGLFELADLPYAGPSRLGAAVAMDKAVMKSLLRDAGLPIVEHLVVYRQRLESDGGREVRRIRQRLGYPVFVKPANLGSSVGVSRAGDDRELTAALREAARYDAKLVVETAVPHPREVECSVLGNDRATVSVPGEIIPDGEFYDYRAKYLSSATELRIPAPLPDRQAQRLRNLALAAYRAVEGCGMARVDFLLGAGRREVYVNEVNTIPGFTQVSMYPKLWEASGLPYEELVDLLIRLGLECHEVRRRSEVRYRPPGAGDEAGTEAGT